MESIKELIENNKVEDMIYNEDVCVQKEFEEDRAVYFQQHGNKELAKLCSSHVLSSYDTVFVLSSDYTKLLYMYDESWADMPVRYGFNAYINVTDCVLNALNTRFRDKCDSLVEFIADVVLYLTKHEEGDTWLDTFSGILAEVLWGFKNKHNTVRIYKEMSVSDTLEVIAKTGKKAE